MVLVLVFGVKKSEVIPPVNPHSHPHNRLPPSPQLNAGPRLTPAFPIYSPIHFDCARLCSFIVTAHGGSNVVCRCVDVGLSVKVRECVLCDCYMSCGRSHPFACSRFACPSHSTRFVRSSVQSKQPPAHPQSPIRFQSILSRPPGPHPTYILHQTNQEAGESIEK